MDNYIVDNKGQTSKVCEPSGSWGGSWTEQKLNAFEKYVNAYLTIMNANRDKYGWKLVYFDGFAGSGTRGDSNNQQCESTLDLYLDLGITPEELTPYRGAAERVLGIKQRGFDYYYFIDKDKDANAKLKDKLKRMYEDRKLEFRPTDANGEVKNMALFLQKNQNYKALVLLDPFGMQLDWDTIKNLENSSTDLWILIPTGMIVNRLLDHKGELKYNEKLISFFGKDEDFLRDYFYKKRTELSLFGESTIIEKVRNPIQKIAELYIQQLQTVFKYVTPKPLVLYNSRNTPIFHFAFASNNQTAMKIAHEIINK